MKRKVIITGIALLAALGAFSQDSSPATAPKPTGMPGAQATTTVPTTPSQQAKKEEHFTPQLQTKETDRQASFETERPRTAPELPKQPAATTKQTEGSPQ